MMLSTLLISAHIFLPPLAIVTTLAVISALFAGAASFTLGVDFWIRTFSKESKDNKQEINNDLCEQAETKSDEAKSVSKSSSFATSFCGLFGKSHKKALIDKSATAANSQQVDRASGSFSKAG
jgi:preprotein translocase subunit SecF